MAGMEKLAKAQFKKLPKKEQKAINALRRIPACRGSVCHGPSKYGKKDRRWRVSDYADALYPVSC